MQQAAHFSQNGSLRSTLVTNLLLGPRRSQRFCDVRSSRPPRREQVSLCRIIIIQPIVGRGAVLTVSRAFYAAHLFGSRRQMFKDDAQASIEYADRRLAKSCNRFLKTGP